MSRRSGANEKRAPVLGADASDRCRLAASGRRSAALAGQLSQDLPTWTHFENASTLAREEDVASAVVCGADVGRLVTAVQEYVDAGFDRLHFHQVGPEQDRFIAAFQNEIKNELPGT